MQCMHMHYYCIQDTMFHSYNYCTLQMQTISKYISEFIYILFTQVEIMSNNNNNNNNSVITVVLSIYSIPL